MAIKPEAMDKAIREFSYIPRRQVPERGLLIEGPLSTGLSAVYGQAGDAAMRFVESKNQGLGAFQRGIEQIKLRAEEFDLQGEAAIKRLFAETPTAVPEGP